MDRPPNPASPAWPAGPGHGGPGRARPAIRVLIAEDARVMRETLVALLGLEDDIEVTAALAAGDGIVPTALELHPDVALLDIGLPGVDGVTAAAELGRRVPSCRVLILTGLDAPGRVRAALQAGISGFLLKDGSADALIDAVRTVARGGRVIDSRLAGGPQQSGPPGLPRRARAAGSPPSGRTAGLPGG